MSDTINVGLLGHGVVGGGVARTLRDKADTIARRVGRRVVLRGVLVRDPARHTDADWLQITSDPAEVLDDPDVQVVAEMMGGEQPAHEYIRRAIANGRDRGRFSGLEKMDPASRTKPNARHPSGRTGSPGGATTHANARNTSAKLSASDVSQNAYNGVIDATRNARVTMRPSL